MKTRFLLISILLSQHIFSQSFQRIHKKAVVIDSHNDILTQSIEKDLVFDTNLKGKSHSDLSRWKQGGLDAQLFSVWCDGDKKQPFAYANRQMDTLDAV